MAIAARGAAVAGDLFHPRRFRVFHLAFSVSFAVGLIAILVAFSVNMDNLDADVDFVDPWGPQNALQNTSTTVDDPAVSVLQQSSSEEELPPPNAYNGILRQGPVGSTLLSVLKNMFHIDIEVPGLIRVFNSFDEIIHHHSRFENFAAPRQFFVAVSSYTVFCDIELLLAHSQSSPAWKKCQEACHTDSTHKAYHALWKA